MASTAQAVTTATFSATMDTSITNRATGNGGGAATILAVGGDKYGYAHRALIEFNVSGLLHSTINYATFNAYMNKFPNGALANSNFAIARVTSYWYDGQNTGNGTGSACSNYAATWNQRECAYANWGTAGGDNGGWLGYVAPGTGTTSGWMTWGSTVASSYVSSLVNQWAKNTYPNYGLELYSLSESTAFTVRGFSSMEGGTAPYLWVNFTCDTGYPWDGSSSCALDYYFCSNTAPTNGTATFTGGLYSGYPTYNSTANYACNYGYTLSGTATATCQSNQTWSSALPSCSVVPYWCASPSVTNGGYSLSGGVDPGYPSYNSTATYTCNAGYTNSGSASGVCQANKTWSATPNCTAVTNYCGTPPVVANSTGSPVVSGGVAGGSTNSLNATATYTCATGYKFSGGSTSTCQSGGTWSTAPTCIVDNLWCAAPTTTNGGYTLTGGLGGNGTQSYQATANYTCNAGYANSGSATGVCQAGKTWSASASCTVVSNYCPTLPSMSNGSWGTASGGLAGGSTWSYGASITYTCGTGYTGGGTATCQSGGTWSTPTACTVVTPWCAAAPTNISNGNYVLGAGAGGYTNTYGATATYSCSGGYSISGTNPSTCQANQTWSTAPSCGAIAAYCPAVPSVSNAVAGTATGGAAGGSTLSVNATVTYTCNGGYSISGTNPITCQSNGTWTSGPTCTAIASYCSLPPTVTNGSLSGVSGGAAGGSTDSVGATASYTCATGYTFSGGSTATCQSNGTWSTAPTCIVDVAWCAAAPSVTNAGTPSLTGGLGGSGTTSYQASATYTCNGGYTGGGSSSCQADRTWSASPTCSAVTNYCGAPATITNEASVSVSGGAAGGSTYSVGAIAAYTCNAGYTVVGSAPVCQSNGTWSTAPTCSPVSNFCGAAPTVGNAGVPIVSGGAAGGSTSSLGATAAYTCNTGYTKSGSDSVCQSSGLWSTAPSCTADPLWCSAAPAVTNAASVTVSGGIAGGSTTSLSANASYTCNGGYSIGGTNPSTCQANHTWTTSPTCNVITSYCSAPPSVANAATVSVSGGAAGGSTTSVGASATYTCNGGYALVGGAATCQTNGTWSAAPSCTAITNYCNTPPIVSNAAGAVVSGGAGGGTSTSVGATAAYSCNLGYTKSGLDSVCQSNGSWSAAPTCSPTDCGSPPIVSNEAGSPVVSGGDGGGSTTTYGATAFYTCLSGFAENGSNPTCQASGLWTLAPTCDDINECLSSPCGVGTCNNTVGSYTCSCPTNYTFSNGTCELVTACNNGTATCLPIAICTSSDPMNFSCSCPSGYTGDGQSACTDINECTSGTNNCTATNSTCTNTPGSFTCGCIPGYTGDGITSCTPISNYCGTPPSIANAGIPTVSGGDAGGTTDSLNAIATYVCSTGYGFTGGATATCLSGGSWSTAPTCAPIASFCGAAPTVLDAGAPTISGGIAGGSTSSLNAIAAYTCDAGYTKSGSDSQCLAAGWSAAPTCNAISNYCGAPPVVGNASAPTVSGGAGGLGTYSLGAIASYTCDPGYTKSGSDSVCGSGGTWSVAPSCVVVTSYCPAAPTVVNGSGATVSGGAAGGSTTSYGATASYACNAGYAFTGASTATCQADTTWSATPVCGAVASYCGTPPIVANANAPTVSGGAAGGSTSSLGAVAAYGCVAGYTHVGSDSTCQGNGTWSTPPTCVEDPAWCAAPPTVPDAGMPTIAGGIGGGTTTSLDAIATYTCNDGYAFVGGSTSTCQASRAWSTAPTCAVVTSYCAAPPVVANAGSPAIAGGLGGASTTSLNAVATYTCDPGYGLTGGATSTCVSGGSWTSAPSCVPTASYCGLPPAVANAGTPVVSGGIAGGTTDSLGATATYTCNAGFDLAGTMPTCGVTGAWSAAPTCVPRDCGTPPVVANATTPTVSGGAGGGATTTFGATASYTCNSGYALTGTDPLCEATGTWGPAPSCTDIDECLTNNGGCGNATYYSCTNNVGAPPTCADINECLTNNGGCGDPTFFTCANNIGAPPTCADINECLTNNGGCGSATYFTCTNNVGALPTCGDVNECATNNGGCGSATYWLCTNNYGAAPTCSDIDECLTNNGGCGNPVYTSCTNNVGAAPTCTDINECLTNNGGCGDPTFFSCTNNVAAAPTCADINECLTNNGGCGSATYFTCTNNVGALPTCADINECLTNNGGCGSATYWLCTNNAGAPPTCADIDECATNNGGCGDPALYTCTNNVGAAPTCGSVDDCAPKPCPTNAVCIDGVGTWTCTCPTGYASATPDDAHGVTSCNDVDECALHLDDCAPQATCVNIVGSFLCQCAAGFQGTGHVTCQDVNDCLLNNGGCAANETCVNLYGTPRVCICSPGYARPTPTGTCVLTCGEGNVGPGELCDDGNLINGDGCSSTCMIEPGWACHEPQVCVVNCDGGVPDGGADGGLDAGVADAGDAGGADAAIVGFTDPSVCVRTCGDGLIQPPQETCDDGPNNSDTVPGACRTNCRLAGCGDAMLDPGEACDNGFYNSDTVPDACRTSCQKAFCGDGVLDPMRGETCDPGGGAVLDDAICQSRPCSIPTDGGVGDGGTSHVRARGGCSCDVSGTSYASPLALATATATVLVAFALRRRRTRAR